MVAKLYNGAAEWEIAVYGIIPFRVGVFIPAPSN